MNIDKLFRKFKARLLREACLTAFLIAVSFSAASVFLVSLIYHVLTTDAPLRIFIIICTTTFLISFLFTFTICYPTRKKIATRIDETGLQERIRTMLEYQSIESDILRLQRADALLYLNQTLPSQMRFRPQGKLLLLCLICILSAAIITGIPYDIGQVNVTATGITNDQLQIIEDLLTRLREESKSPAIPKEAENQLYDIINRLETGLKDSNTDLEMVAQIENARQLIKEALEPLLTQHAIGEALQQFELTAGLGEAISASDGNAVSAALLDLKILLSEDNQRITILSQNINDALIASGVSSENQLFRALNDFAVALLTVPDAENIYRALSDVVTTAEEAILAALADQVATEFGQNLLDSILSDAKDRILGINPDLPEYAPPNIDMPESSESGTPEGETPEGGMPDGDVSEDGQGNGQGDSGDEQYMLESIYDPVSGNISYREVFALYYAEYLKALKAGTVPPDWQEIIDRYFSTLDQ